MQEYARFYEKPLTLHPHCCESPGSLPGNNVEARFCRRASFFCCTRLPFAKTTEKHTKNARNRCEIGRFVYIFVYKFRKSLKINVYCGERGSVTHEFTQSQCVPQCRKTLIWCFIVVFYSATQYHICPEKSCPVSCTWVFGAFFVYIFINH